MQARSVIPVQERPCPRGHVGMASLRQRHQCLQVRAHHAKHAARTTCWQPTATDPPPAEGARGDIGEASRARDREIVVLVRIFAVALPPLHGALGERGADFLLARHLERSRGWSRRARRQCSWRLPDDGMHRGTGGPRPAVAAGARRCAAAAARAGSAGRTAGGLARRRSP